MINNFLSEKGVFNISSITEIKHSEQVLKTEVNIDENIKHDEAIDIFIDKISGSDVFKQEVKIVCKQIIKEARSK